VAREKLIQKQPQDDKRDPRQRFSDFASKVFSTPKSDIDQREKRWRKERKRSR